MSCIFCTLCKEGNILYETQKTVVLLDRYPLVHDHLLVIPKIHCEVFTDCPLDYLGDVMAVIQFLIKKLNLEKYNLLQNNKHLQSVHHVHFHVIPHGGLKINWESLKVSEEEYTERVDEMKKRVNE